MKKQWLHIQIGKYRFRFQRNNLTWFGLYYPLKNGMFRDITFSLKYGIDSQEIPF
jgi:hypothetical protein